MYVAIPNDDVPTRIEYPPSFILPNSTHSLNVLFFRQSFQFYSIVLTCMYVRVCASMYYYT